MRVLIAGEPSVHLQNYCRAIKKHIKEIILLTETPANIPEASRSYVANFRGSNPLKWLSNRKEINKIISKEKPDIIHIHQINRLAYFTASSAEKTPIVSTAWGSDVLLMPKKNIIYKNICRYVLRKSKYITADAGIMINAMNDIFPSKTKYVHLQYGINPVQPSNKEHIIYSNRLHKKLYNIEDIIMDFDAFFKKHTGWELHIAGSGTETAQLKELSKKLNSGKKISFLGWLNEEENRKEYAKASIYASIPSSDGVSVSLLESMSANCIPVVSDLPANKEWIEDGINGVIKKENTNPFEEALKLNLENCFSINQKKIRDNAEKNKTTEIFFNLYCKAINE